MGILTDSVGNIKGVGPKRLSLLDKLGIRTIEDLLFQFPYRFEDRTRVAPVNELALNEYQLVRGL